MAIVDLEEESNLVQHARRELALIGNGPEIDDHVIQMIEIFSKTGHSGYSGFYTIGLITKLLNFENLTPLTDNPDEWYFHDYSTSGWKHGIYQNVRNGEAFSYDGGKTYYLLSENRQDKRKVETIFHKSISKENNMAIRHKAVKHPSSGETGRAIKVTEKNFIDVANWSGGMAISKVSKDGDVSRQRVRLKGLMAQVGDYIVRVQKGVDDKNKPVWHFFRVKKDVFESDFSFV